MKKIVSILIIALLLTFTLGVSVYAEDTTETTAQTTEQTPAPVTPPTGEQGAQEKNSTTQTDEEELSVTQFFNEKILPLLVAAFYAVVGLIAFSAPYIKKIVKFNKLHGIYLKQKEENENLKSLLNMTDISKFKEAVETAFTEYVKHALDAVKIDNNLVANLTVQIEVMKAQIQSLIAGATNAWAQSPGAVACLSAAPTESALRVQAAYIAALEGHIKESKGEEAEKILTELKGA